MINISISSLTQLLPQTSSLSPESVSRVYHMARSIQIAMKLIQSLLQHSITTLRLCQKICQACRRPSAKTWTRAVNRGVVLFKMMQADDTGAGQLFDPPRTTAESSFTLCDLQKWGYTVENFPDDHLLVSYRDAMRSLGYSPITKAEGGPNIPIVHFHSISTSFDGETYPWSEGFFVQIINPVDGIIGACSNQAPQHAASGRKPIPKLNRWSDVAFLQWKQCSLPTSNLQYVLRLRIGNKQTRRIIGRILQYDSNQLKLWPGTDFEPMTADGHPNAQFHALLGSPNGRGVGYLLAQHKRELGHKVVDRITLFRQKESGWWPSILFHIKDVE